MPDDDLRVALVGYGLAGGAIHAPLIAATPGLRLAAVVTRDPLRREAVARAHPGARAVDTLEDALDDADVVVVAAPNRFHVPLAQAALDAGRHVVVDKPLAVTAAEARALAAQADARRVVLAPFHNRRWDDDFLTLRREVDLGHLGRVLRLESRFDRWRPVVRNEAWREEGAAAAGGGLLLDLGTHLVDQAVQLLGPVTHVYAELERRRPGAAVEDDVFLALTHAGGMRSHLWAGVHAAQTAPRMRVLGDAGTFVSEGLDPQEEQLRSGVTPAAAEFGRRHPMQAATVHDGERATLLTMERGDWPAFYAALVAAVRDGAPPPVDPAQAVAVAELLEAARRSAAQRTVVAVG